MAITKTDATVENVKVVVVEGAANYITATVNHALSDDSTDPATIVTRVRTDVVVSNATSGELTAVQSIVSKAAALAVA
jgi:hypothetical protein